MSNSSRPIVEVQGLSKSYRSHGKTIDAIVDISFSLSRGEVLALLGPNGSGKTTTIDCMMGLTIPDRGSILILEKDVRSARQQIACVSGTAEFYWMFTGLEILTTYMRISGSSSERLTRLSDRFGIASILDRKWHAYSSGEQMRIRLIRALLSDPQILLLDEPSVGLDPNAAEIMRQELARLRDEGKAILLTSHHMLDIERLADRACFISKGKVVSTGPLSAYQRPLGLIEIEYDRQLSDVPSWMTQVRGNRYVCPIEKLREVVAMGNTTFISSKEESLEDYFRRTD